MRRAYIPTPTNADQRVAGGRGPRPASPSVPSLELALFHKQFPQVVHREVFITIICLQIQTDLPVTS